VRYVVCYDITDDRRREHLSAILLDFGQRIQESVFVADLDEELAGKMQERVKNVLDGTLDRLHIFPLCAACSSKTVSMGAAAELPRDEDFYIL
jgi:CRISPR-associated protein Cas2